MFGMQEEQEHATNGHVPMSLEESLRITREFSDREERDRPKPDLEEYQRAQRKQEHAAQHEGRSLYRRVVDTVLMRGPDHAQRQLLVKSQQTLNQFDARYDAFQESVEQQRAELVKVTQRARREEQALEATTVQYVSRRDRVDASFAQLEEMRETASVSTTDFYEQQHVLLEEQSALIELESQGNAIQAQYEASMQLCEALTQNVQFLQDQSRQLGNQRSQLRTHVRTLTAMRSLDEATDGVSVRDVYERSGIIVSELKGAMDLAARTKRFELDTTYQSNRDREVSLPMSERWEKAKRT